MKFFCTLFVAFFIAGSCFAGDLDVANSTKNTSVHYSLRHPKKGVRTDGKPDKTDIKPVAQTSGISTGLVVIYGHVVNPPYKVSVDANVISINSVPVGEMATEKGRLSAKAGDLINQANTLFCDAVGKKANDGNAGEILALFQKTTDVVVSAKWLKNEPPPKGVLIVNWKDGVRNPGVQFSVGSCHSQTATSARAKHAPSAISQPDSARQAAGMQKALEHDSMLFFASDGTALVLPTTAKTQILEIVRDERLGRKELREKLSKLGFSNRGAIEIIRNYNPD